MRTGRAVVCRLIDREPVLYQGRPTGSETVKFAVPPQVPGASETEVSYVLRTKGNDVILLDARRAVLAIVPPESPCEAILILRNYHPLGLTDSERQQADAALSNVLGTQASGPTGQQL